MVREIKENELNELLALYLHLHEESVPELTEHLKRTWNTILQDTNHHIIVKEAEGKIVSIIDACCGEIAAAGEKEVSLIASEGTIQSGVFAQGLNPYGIGVRSPENQQYLMQRELIEAVKQDCITDEVVEKFIELVKSFSGDALILGCTEFPVLYSRVPRGTFGNIRIYDPLECAIHVLQRECK